MVDVMSAISQMGNHFSTAIEAMSARITQLEGWESLPLTSSHPTTPQRGDEGESDRPSLWVDRSMSEIALCWVDRSMLGTHRRQVVREDLYNPQGVGEHGSVSKGNIHQNSPKCS